MIKYFTVETERHHDDAKVLRVKATYRGKEFIGPFDTATPEVDSHRATALNAIMAFETGDFELVGYGELKDPTHLVFIFSKL